MKTEENTNPTKMSDEQELTSIDLFTENTIKITEMITKQLGQSFKMYNDFFNLSFPYWKTAGDPNESASELLKKSTESYLNSLKTISENSLETMNKAISAFPDFALNNSLSDGTMEYIMKNYEKQVSQMMDFSKQIFEKSGQALQSKKIEEEVLIEKSEKKQKPELETTSIEVVNKSINKDTAKTNVSSNVDKNLVKETQK